METNTDALESITAEASRFEKQRDAARAEAERATKVLEELNSRKAALGGLPDERGGVKGLGALAAALNEETATHSRTREVAEEAVRELDRLILEAEVRLRDEQKRLARKRYEALSEERYNLDGEAEEVMAGLLGVLDQLEGLREDQVSAADDAGNSYAVRQDPGATIEYWLTRRLRHWISNGSFEKYDAPLSELDPLALNPERDKQSNEQG